MPVDFTGRWEADLSQSKLVGHLPTAMTIVIAQSDHDLCQKVVIRKNGREERITFHCVTDGRANHCRLNEEAVRGSADWDGDQLVIEIWVENGGRELYLCDCWSLSQNGQILTMEHRNDALAGQVTVLRKVD